MPTYDEYRESLFANLVEPMDQYILCKMKIDQLKKQGYHAPTMEAIDAQMMAAKDRIAEILIQQKDLVWTFETNSKEKK